MRYYVTLFDSNYLTRGLVLYRSLVRLAQDFHLWIICFDDLAYEILNQLNLAYVTLVSSQEFEDPELLKIKSERTRQEYCWSCTPSTLYYVFNHAPEVDQLTYLDADLMFFSSVEKIFQEKPEASILLTEHRYLPNINSYLPGVPADSDITQTHGKYNVQFMTFKRDEVGLQAVNWWRERCLEWCFARVEEGKFGDQKYLNDWLDRFKNVHVLENLGVGLAPWNAAQYKLEKKDDKVFVENDALIFYHFHGLKLHSWHIAHLCDRYPCSPQLRNLVYKPYLEELEQAYEIVRYIKPGFTGGIAKFPRIPKRPTAFYNFAKMMIADIQTGRYCKYA